MSIYEQGIATKPHYLRLSEEDSDKVRNEAMRLGIPLTELFRRMVDLYFEVKSAVPASGPTLTPHQAQSLHDSLDAGKARPQDKRFDFTGGNGE